MRSEAPDAARRSPSPSEAASLAPRARGLGWTRLPAKSLTVALLCLAGAGAVRAEAPAHGSREIAEIRARMDEMRARQDQLEAENATLRDRVSALASGEESGIVPVGAGGARGSAAPEVRVGMHRGGGGYFIQSDDDSFRLLGYAQAVGSLFDGRLDRTDGNGDFSIRRARIDFLADFFEDFQLLVEFDGGPTSSSPGSSDFALVEARLNWKVLDDALQLRFGKFTSPFSTENFRSSRDIDTIERYVALNSLFGLPAFDTQTGAMVYGQLGDEPKLGYYLAVFNGNGRANDNLSDGNNNKELVAKATFADGEFSGGLAFDYSKESAQPLGLSDLAFDRFVSVPVEDRRVGLEADLFWTRGAWSVRAEGVAFDFESPIEDRVGLYGGFVQPGYFLWGDKSDGLQLLLRAELARLDADTGDDGDTLYSGTLGANWFVNPNVRVQVNGVLQYFDGPSTALGFSDRELIPLLLTEVQFKF